MPSLPLTYPHEAVTPLWCAPSADGAALNGFARSQHGCPLPFGAVDIPLLFSHFSSVEVGVYELLLAALGSVQDGALKLARPQRSILRFFNSERLTGRRVCDAACCSC